MGYSIGGNTLPQIEDKSLSALDAVNKAYDSMNSGMEKLANIPFIGRKMVQDNADARYSAALNKFSNDPEGLARALANGDISTTDVTADTLNKTQDRLKNIQDTATSIYAQNRLKATNDYFDKNGALYQEANNAAQAGNTAKLAQIRANLGEVPWEVGYEIAKLNAQAEKDTQRQLANQGAIAGLANQKYQNAMAASQGLYELDKTLRALNLPPQLLQNARTEWAKTGKVTLPNGKQIDLSGVYSAIAKSPETLALAGQVWQNAAGLGSVVQNQTPSNQGDDAHTSSLLNGSGPWANM